MDRLTDEHTLLWSRFDPTKMFIHVPFLKQLLINIMPDGCNRVSISIDTDIEKTGKDTVRYY